MQHTEARPTFIGTREIVRDQPVKYAEYWGRYATTADAREMGRLLREVFPTLDQPTSFTRDVQRPDMAHMLAVRKLRPDEVRGQQARSSGLLGALRDLWHALPIFGNGNENGNHTDERIAGLVSLWIVHDQAHITAIATSPEERRKGIGGALMIMAINEAIDRGADIVTLEVRSKNQRARTLYRRFGFAETGLRRNYYRDPIDHAIIMSTPNMRQPAFRQLFQLRVDEHDQINGITAFEHRKSR